MALPFGVLIFSLAMLSRGLEKNKNHSIFLPRERRGKCSPLKGQNYKKARVFLQKAKNELSVNSGQMEVEFILWDEFNNMYKNHAPLSLG